MTGKTTREVCDILQVSYEDLMSLYYNLGDRIPVEKVGRNLIWSGKAVSTARRMLAAKKTKRAMRQTEEAQNFAEAASRLRKAGIELRRLGESLTAIYATLRKNPPTVTGFLHTLPDKDLRLITPIAVLLSPTDRQWTASLAEAGLQAEGDTRERALVELRETLIRTYRLLRSDPKLDPAMWRTLRQLIRAKRPLPWLARPPEAESSEEKGEEVAE
jgi:hypothetical protein